MRGWSPLRTVSIPQTFAWDRTQLVVESASRSLVCGCTEMGTRAQIEVKGAQAAGDREAGNGPESISLLYLVAKWTAPSTPLHTDASSLVPLSQHSVRSRRIRRAGRRLGSVHCGGCKGQQRARVVKGEGQSASAERSERNSQSGPKDTTRWRRALYRFLGI